MARIKIEDLPVAENLTPEQEALVEGAGLRPFRPRLEGLEDRQLMDAGIGQALLAPMAPTVVGDHAQDGHVQILGGQLQSVDAQTAGQKATDLLNQAFAGKQLQGNNETFDHLCWRVASSVYQEFNRGFVNNGSNVWGLRVAVSYDPQVDEESETVLVRMGLGFKDGKEAGMVILLHYEGRTFDTYWFRCLRTAVSQNNEPVTDYEALQVATQVKFFLTTVGRASTQASTEMSFAALGVDSQRIGQMATDRLNAAFAGKTLQGQSVDGFSLLSASESHVKVEVTLNGGQDRQTLTFNIVGSSDPNYRDLDGPTQEGTGFQFSGESLSRLRSTVFCIDLRQLAAPQATSATDAAFASLAQPDGAR
jgi:hypothetical protein